jgi:ATP-dependent DNA ligase
MDQAPRGRPPFPLSAVARPSSPLSLSNSPAISSAKCLNPQPKAEAILVAYDLMEADGHDMRPGPLEARRKRLTKLLSRSNKALRDGIQLSEAITGDGAAIFRHACWMDLEGIVSERVGSRYLHG